MPPALPPSPAAACHVPSPPSPSHASPARVNGAEVKAQWHQVSCVRFAASLLGQGCSHPPVMNYLTCCQRSSCNEVYADSAAWWDFKISPKGWSLRTKRWPPALLDGEFEQIQPQNTSPMTGLLSSFPHLPLWLPTRGHCKTHFNLQFEVSTDYPFFQM